ncbi:fibronectin type III domain-containing protein [Rathayibacter sp. CAU 1779]
MRNILSTVIGTGLAAVIAVTTIAPVQAADDPSPVNLLASDFDTTFSNPATRLDNTTTDGSGTQTPVSIDGDPAMELRDSSNGGAISAYFLKRFSSGALKDRINAVYKEPVGSAPVDFELSFNMARTAASTKPVAKDIYAQIAFGNFDNVNVPRFPVPATTLTTTAAYNATDGKLHEVSSQDIGAYRFTIVPNGGARIISTVELDFSVRVDTGGTDEAIVVDDLSVAELAPVNDTVPPSAPGAVTGSVNGNTATLSWGAASDDQRVASYSIYRDGELAGTTGGAVTTGQVTGLMPSTHYTFTVKARDGGNNEGPASPPLTLTTAASVPSAPSPYPGTTETRLAWLWQKTKDMKEESGPLNVVQYTAQLADGQNVDQNLAKLDTMFGQYDAEQYKTEAKMYAYLMVGDQFSASTLAKVKSYFAGYAYGKLPQTENLRMANYVAGYLVGTYLPDVVDLNGNSGTALADIGKQNIEDMINAGVHRGWAEYESPEYTFMTYFGLNAIYQWAKDDGLRQQAKMAMDVMWFEWANDWINGYMISSLSRAKGDLSSIGDPTWRPADHTALAWAYFGEDRAQQTIGESDNGAPSAYRPNLEYLGFVAWPGTKYQPPALAVQLGQKTDKSYTSHKSNLQNSSGRAMDVDRTTYVQPDWGVGTEVQYRRVDNWLEDQPLVVRWRSTAPNSLFRMSVDQGNAAPGNYDQPADHRVMQDDGAAVGVFRNSGDSTSNTLTAMFPANGSIVEKKDVAGWTVVNTGPMYFAYRMVKPSTWYYQTPNDPSNKVKTNTQIHPTTTLAYAYDILRSQSDRNGWIFDSADASAYPSLDAFAAAITSGDRMDASGIDDAAPHLVYRDLAGKTLDLTFDAANAAPSGNAKVDGVSIPYDSYGVFDTPWLKQDRLSDVFTATLGDTTLRYDFSNWTVTTITDDGATAAPATGVLSSDNGWDTGLQDGDYNVTMNLWWGQNATDYKLYENGTLIADKALTMNTPATQKVVVPISGRKNGTYVYTAELGNSKGASTPKPLTVTVTDANPGLPVLTDDNTDHDGTYSVAADMWWGTNATSYRMTENGVEIASGSLTAATPSAQHVAVPVTGRTPGRYAYVVEFADAAGTTTSRTLYVDVK